MSDAYAFADRPEADDTDKPCANHGVPLQAAGIHRQGTATVCALRAEGESAQFRCAPLFRLRRALRQPPLLVPAGDKALGTKLTCQMFFCCFNYQSRSTQDAIVPGFQAPPDLKTLITPTEKNTESVASGWRLKREAQPYLSTASITVSSPGHTLGSATMNQFGKQPPGCTPHTKLLHKPGAKHQPFLTQDYSSAGK